MMVWISTFRALSRGTCADSSKNGPVLAGFRTIDDGRIGFQGIAKSSRKRTFS